MPADASDALVRTFYRELTDQGLPNPSEPRRRALAVSPPEAGGEGEAIPGPGPTQEARGETAQALADLRGAQRETDAPGYPIEVRGQDAAGNYPRTSPGTASTFQVITTLPMKSDLSSHALYSRAESSGGVSSWVTSPGGRTAGATSLEGVFTFVPREWKREGRVNEADAELIIQGRAEPGAQFTLFEQPVRLRPDGTFSVRRRLPDGTIIVPLIHPAEAASGEDSEGGGT
jgi:hypothetical protein